MPKFKLDPEIYVNEKAWYDESMILKIWDQYIKYKKLKYFYAAEVGASYPANYIASLFEGQYENLLSRNAAILLNNDDTLYLRKNNTNNTEICSISLCSLVRNPIIQSIPNFDPATSNLEIALKQIDKWNKLNNERKIQNHIILFPYYLGGLHWCLGTLQVKFSQPFITADLQFYDSLAETKYFDTTVCGKIKNLLQAIFSPEKRIMLNNNLLITNQQYDSDSCGAFVAENGKDIIDGSNQRLRKNYPAGAKELRIQHLKEIANDAFTLQQKEDNGYIDPKIDLLSDHSKIKHKFLQLIMTQTTLHTEFDGILDDIYKDSTSNEASIVAKLKEFIVRHQNIFEAIKIDSKIGVKNIFELLFSDSTGTYRDGAFDTLSYIMRDLLNTGKSKESKSNYLNRYIHYPSQQESNLFDRNIYRYPERIPNLIQREQLEKHIREKLEENRIAILTGLNGYGKTVLALQYVYKHLDSSAQYDCIIWLDCQELCPISDCQTKIIKYIAWDKGTRSFDKTIKYLSLDQTTSGTNYSHSHNIVDIHKLITKEVPGKTWLIIYDNVISYTDLAQKTIPPNGHIICTSRYKDWTESINVGPFSVTEGAHYFADIFFQSSESAAIEQYRDKYFENMLGTADKARRFYKAAEKLTKKLHGYPLMLADAARSIRESGLTVEKFVQEKKYEELSNFQNVTLEEFIGTNLHNSKIEENAKQILYYCAYLNHAGITREILEEIHKRIKKNEYDFQCFNEALNVLIYLSILNTDSSHATDYFYIPDILKRLLLKHIKDKSTDNNLKFVVPNTILEIINEKLKNHMLNPECTGEEFVRLEQDIYMWVAHAKELYKHLAWRKKFSVHKIKKKKVEYEFKKKGRGYEPDEVTNVIKLYLKKGIAGYKEKPETIDYFLLLSGDENEYEILDSSSGYKYSIIITSALDYNIRSTKLDNMLRNICAEFAVKQTFCWKILIPCFVKKLNYWLTIEIKLHKFLQHKNNIYEIQMLAHDPYGNGDILKTRLHYIYNEVINIFKDASKRSEDIFKTEIINSNFVPQLANDGLDSSGAIAIENIIAIIHDISPTRTYKKGTKFIRYQHLALIERYLRVNEKNIMYKINPNDIKNFRSFLDHHWGFKHVTSSIPDFSPESLQKIEALIHTAEFIHFLGLWYYHHEEKREKAYRCFLESKALYFQLILAMEVKLKEGKMDKSEIRKSYYYERIYNNHLKDSYNFEITNSQLISDYNVSRENPTLYISPRHLIKAYFQLVATYSEYLGYMEPKFFNINKEALLWQALHTHYYLPTSLHQAKKGLNDQTKEWMQAVYKLFTELLRRPPFEASFGYLEKDKETLKKLLEQSTGEKERFKEFELELQGKTLYSLGVSQNEIHKDKDYFKKVQKIDDLLKIIKYNDKRVGSRSGESSEPVYKKLKTLLNNYYFHYYGALEREIVKFYDNFVEYTKIYNSDESKVVKLKEFIELILYDKVKKIESQKINYVTDDYFNKDASLLVLFYKVMFRKLTSINNYLDIDNHEQIHNKLDSLNFVLKKLANNLLETDKNISYGLIFERLRIKLQLHRYFLYLCSDKKFNFKNIPYNLSIAAKLTDDYYQKLIEKTDNTNSSDMEEIFRQSGKFFYFIAKVTFKHLEIIVQGNPLKKLTAEQSKLFKIVVINLQRSFMIHKIRLLQPEHPYLKKASNLYDKVLQKYLGFNPDEIDKDKKIANPIGIELLEIKLNKVNEKLSSHQTLKARKDYDKFNEYLRIRINRVIVCYMLQRYDEALYDCVKLCEENKTYFKAFLFRAHIYYNMERYQEAIADFEYYLQYRPGDYNTKGWLSLAQKKKELKLEHTPLPYITKKMRFVNAFTDKFLIEAKYYADIFLGTNKMLSKAEMSSRVMSALSNLIPNMSVNAPVGTLPIAIAADIKPREAAVELSHIYTQQAEADKLYMASNISHYHNELKVKIQAIAEDIAEDLHPQISRLQNHSVVEFAKYSAEKMLKNVSRGKTNPELPIEQQLRLGLFCYKGTPNRDKQLLIEIESDRKIPGSDLDSEEIESNQQEKKQSCYQSLKKLKEVKKKIKNENWYCNGRWTAEGALTRVGIFATTNHFWVQNRNKEKYGYRYSSAEEAFKLGYKESKDTDNIRLPFLKK